VNANFEKLVTGANPVISYALSTHLWLEHLLVRCLHTALPKPEALFKDRGVNFAVLVSLAEAHAVIEPDFAEVLRRVNSLRNKFAHRLAFEPTDVEIEGVQRAMREMKQPFLMSLMPPSEREMEIAFASICGFLERRARELGATDIDPAKPGAAADQKATSTLIIASLRKKTSCNKRACPTAPISTVYTSSFPPPPACLANSLAPRPLTPPPPKRNSRSGTMIDCSRQEGTSSGGIRTGATVHVTRHIVDPISVALCAIKSSPVSPCLR
jgi:hypothetical protein